MVSTRRSSLWSTATASWLDTQVELASKLPAHLKSIADEAIAEAGLVVSSA